MGKEYRVAWQGDKASGHGAWTTKELAEAWMKYANVHYTDITHWVEERDHG